MKKAAKPLFISLLVIALTAAGLTVLRKNLLEVAIRFTALPYEIQGFPQGEVLLIGSSTMEYWRSSEADLGPVHTVNIGVGGTAVSHWKNHIADLIKPFEPRALVIYVGSNDIHGGEGSKDGDQVAGELEEFFSLLHRELPEASLYYISITPSIQRWHVWPEAARSNQGVSQMAERLDYLSFIDCTGSLLGPDGLPQEELYVSDGLHLSPRGYELFTRAVRPVIIGDLGAEEDGSRGGL
jgi:lysophospholipase L1-like esterase